MNNKPTISSNTKTFLSTDIVNSSAICRTLGDTAYKERLFEPHWTILNECLALHHGIFYEHKGDGLIAWFSAAVDAVECAISMQHRLNNPPLEVKGHRLAVRIGVHRSEVELTPDSEGKYRTGELNYVCRIESIANGNQILLSDATTSYLPNRKDFKWLEWQNRRIKSFDETPVTVWELMWDGQSRGIPGSSWAPDWFIGDVSEYVSRPDLEESIYRAFSKTAGKSSRLVTLHGSGGTGKTRLALTCAVKMAGLFEGRVHFITFRQKPGEVTDGASLLLQELCNALGCEDSKEETILISLTILNNSLFLIDNFESIAGPKAQDLIVKILQRTKDIHVLVTGQKKVELYDIEQVVELQEGMTETEGVALFKLRAQNVYHNWQPTEHEETEIRKIVTMVEGVPLRIEFAAAWLRKRDLKTIVKELAESPLGKVSALPTGGRLAATTREHHQSSELCMEYTCSLLNESERVLFYRFGLFGGSFTSEKAESACSIKNADELIDSLLDASLINRFGSPQEYRYSMHRLTASYCDRKLREQDNRQEIVNQYLRNYTDFALEFCVEDKLRSQSTYEKARAEWGNLKRAAMLGIEFNVVEETKILANHLAYFVRKDRVWTEGTELYGAFLKWYEEVGKDDPKFITFLTSEIGRYHKELGNFTQAIKHYDLSLQTAKSAWGDNSVELLNIIHELADLHRQMVDHVESEQYYLQAISLTETLFGANHPRACSELRGLAILYDTIGKFEEGEKLLVRARAILEPLPDKEAHKYHVILRSLCRHYTMTGKLAEAESVSKQAMAIAERIEGQESAEVCELANAVGYMYQECGRDEEAANYFEKSLAIAEKLYGKDHPTIAEILIRLAWAYALLEREGETEELFKRALAISKRVYGEKHKNTGAHSCNFGLYYIHTKNYEKAEPLLNEALEIYQSYFGPEHNEVAVILCNIGGLLMGQNNYAEAEKTYRRAWAIHEKTKGKMHQYTANMISGVGRVCFETGQFEEGERVFRIALEIREQVFGKDHIDVAGSCVDLGRALLAQKKLSETEELFERALRIYDVIIGPEHFQTKRVREALEKLRADMKDIPR